MDINSLDSMMASSKLSKPDKNDVRLLLAKILSDGSISDEAAVAVVTVAKFHKEWRNFLTEPNIIEFFNNKALLNMMELSKQVGKHNKFSKIINFELDFLSFIVVEFVEIYNTNLDTKSRLRISYG